MTVVVVLATWITPALAVAQGARAGVVTTIEGHVTVTHQAQPAPRPLRFKDDVFVDGSDDTAGDLPLSTPPSPVAPRAPVAPVIPATAGPTTVNIDASTFTIETEPLAIVSAGTTTQSPPSATHSGLSGSQTRRYDAVDGSDVVGPVNLSGGIRVTGSTVSGSMPLFRVANAGAAFSAAAILVQDSDVSLGPGVGATLFDAVDATVTASTGDPFIQFARTVTGVNTVEVASLLRLVGSGTHVDLSGPLMSAQSTDLTFTEEMIAVGYAQRLRSSSTSPLISLDQSPVTAGRHLLGITGMDARVELDGPLIAARDASIELGTSAHAVALLGQSPSLSSTTTDPLISVDGGDLRAPDGAIFHLNGTGASVELGGPAIAVRNGTLEANWKILSLYEGTFTSDSTEPLISVIDGSLSVGGGGGLISSRGTLKLKGPALAMSGVSDASFEDAVIRLEGGEFSSSTTQPLLSFDDTSVTRVSNPVAGVLYATQGAVMDLAGPLLVAEDSPFSMADDAAVVISDAVVTTSSTAPLLSFTEAGSHTFAGTIHLDGVAEQSETVEGNVLVLGTDKPLRHAGVLVAVQGPNVTSNNVVRVDRALLEASKAILELTGGAVFTVDGMHAAVDVRPKGKITANVPGDALIKIHASTMHVNSPAALVSVDAGAMLVTGHLVGVSGGGTLNILNGSLVRVDNGGVFRLTGGSLIQFGSGTNTVNITGSSPLCMGCVVTKEIPNLTGVPVLLANGATTSNVSVAPGFTAYGGTGSVNVSGPSGAVLKVDGSTSKIVLAP